MLAENNPTVSTNTISHPTLSEKSRRPLRRVDDVGALRLLADSDSLSVLGSMAKAYTLCVPCYQVFCGIHPLGSQPPRGGVLLSNRTLRFLFCLLDSRCTARAVILG